jgi:Na+-driven multidrug efflux pump
VTDTSDQSLTEGSLVRPMFRLARPIIVIQLLQVTYNLADMLWLGRYSNHADDADADRETPSAEFGTASGAE